MRHALFIISTALISIVMAPLAFADIAHRPATGGPGGLPSRGNGVALETSIGRADGDLRWDTSLSLALDLPVPSLGCIDPTLIRCVTRFRVAARTPFSVTLVDGGPPNAEPEDTTLTQDLSRHFQLRYLEYGYDDEPIHILVGELSGVSLGHGTIINEYYNVLDGTEYQIGLQANINSPYAGGAFMMDNVISPSVMGGRVYVRPLAMLTGMPLLTQFGIGTSFVTDLNAPVALAGSGGVRFNQYNQPAVSQTARASFVSTDIEFNWVDIPRVKVGSYVDFNWTLMNGRGVHAGTRVKLDPLRRLALSARFEYRWLGNGYIPDYIGPLYEAERYQTMGWGSGAVPQPKLGLVYGKLGGASHGAHTQLSATLFDIFTLTGAYADYEGDYNSTMWFRAALAPVDIYQFSVFYYKTNIKDSDHVLDPSNSMVAAEARVGIVWPVYLFGQYSNLWLMESASEYAMVNNWRAGLGASFVF